VAGFGMSKFTLSTVFSVFRRSEEFFRFYPKLFRLFSNSGFFSFFYSPGQFFAGALVLAGEGPV
jgi:hypothetical protein